MNDEEYNRAWFDLMQAVAAYRHEPIHFRLEKFGKRESMVHLDVLVLTILPGSAEAPSSR